MRTLSQKPTKLQNRLLSLVKRNLNEQGYVDYSLADLAERLGYKRDHKSSVQRALNYLKKKGALDYTPGENWTKTRIWLVNNVNSTHIKQAN